MDIERYVDGKDWRMLAENLNVGQPFINWLTNNKRVDRPTEYVLRFYENCPNSKSTKSKLRYLAEMLKDMGRHDAEEVIREYLTQRSSL